MHFHAQIFVCSHVFEFSATSLFILRVDDLPFVKKRFILNMSCNYWDAGAGTVEQQCHKRTRF